MGGILVIGAGGHGKVVADILLSAGREVAGFLDDNPSSWGTMVLGLPVLGPIERYQEHSPHGLILGVGSNRGRQRIVARLGVAAHPLWTTAIHPRATVASSVRVGAGVVIAAGAVVNPDSYVGGHAIVNTAASVDHDCTIGDFAHLAPGVHLAGSISIGEGTLIGIGTVILPGRRVGAWSTVGGGSTVVRDIPDGVTAKGLPARWA